MKKILVFAMLVGASCAFAADSYIYWLLPDSAAKVAAGDYTAKVSAYPAQGESSYLNIYSGTGEYIGPDGVSVSLGDNADNVPYFADAAGYLTDTDNYTFYIELWNDKVMVAASDGLKYSAASLGAIAGMGTPGNVWAVTFGGSEPPGPGPTPGPTPVPEPTSGLLMLVGASVLALRRKKLQKKA